MSIFGKILFEYQLMAWSDPARLIAGKAATVKDLMQIALMPEKSMFQRLMRHPRSSSTHLVFSAHPIY